MVPLISLMASPAWTETWRDIITAADQERLDRLPEALIKGEEFLATMEPPAAEKDLRTLRQLIVPGSLPIKAKQLTGEWQCRLILVTDLLIVYDWFRCRIQNTEEGLSLEKYTGSVPYSGHLFPNDETSMIFLGGDHLAYYSGHPELEGPMPAKLYSGWDEAARRKMERDKADLVGVLNRLSKNHLRIMLPWPHFSGSAYDILELRR